MWSLRHSQASSPNQSNLDFLLWKFVGWSTESSYPEASAWVTSSFFEPNKSQGHVQNMELKNPMNFFICLISCLIRWVLQCCTGIWFSNHSSIQDPIQNPHAMPAPLSPKESTALVRSPNGGRLGNLRSPKRFSLGCEGFTSTAPGRDGFLKDFSEVSEECFLLAPGQSFLIY